MTVIFMPGYVHFYDSAELRGPSTNKVYERLYSSSNRWTRKKEK